MERETKTSRGDVALRQGKQKEAPWTSSCSFWRTAGEELGCLDAEVSGIERMELRDGRIQEAGMVGVGQRRSSSLLGLTRQGGGFGGGWLVDREEAAGLVRW